MHAKDETDPAGERWAGAGHSTQSDSAQAGQDAVVDAVRGKDPRLVVVFASPRHDLDALAAAAAEAAGPAQLIGCSSAGELSRHGHTSSSVVALALGGRGFSSASAAGSADVDGPRTAGEQVAGCLESVEDLGQRVLILLADAGAGDPQDVVRGAYSVAGAAVPLAGACAGSDRPGGEVRQFHGGRVLSRSVVGAALSSSAPLGVGVRHGWQPAGEPLLVTASHATTLETLGERPALDAYLELVDAPAGARSDPEAFSRLARLHPLGVASPRRREMHVRALMAPDFERGTLRCAAEIPQGTLVWMMRGVPENVMAAGDAACAEALAALGGAAPLGVLAFDCVSRAELLGPELEREGTRRLIAATGGAALAGFRSYGEIARTHGLTGYHNQALSILAIG